MMREFTNEDCMDLMKRYPDKFFELAIVDPPYGIDINKQMKNPNINKNWKKHILKDWDNKKPDKKYFEELFRTTKNQIIWGGNYFELPIIRGWIIWDKIQEFSTGEFEMAWNSQDMPTKAFRMARCEAYVNQYKIHPTQKPIALYKWLLSKYAKPGDKILDTHVGSASSLIACEDMGFEYVGCELDADYYKAACERIAIFRAQGKLQFEED